MKTTVTLLMLLTLLSFNTFASNYTQLNVPELAKTLTGHTEVVWRVPFSPDGNTLASGSRDKTIRLWNPHTGARLRTLTGHTKEIFSVSFSPDGNTLASGSVDKTVRLWNPHTGARLRTLTGHTSYVYSVSFSPDGNTLASGSRDKTVRLWNPHTGALIRTLTGHTDDVKSVLFSPDGNTLASGSNDKTVRLWDTATGGGIRTLTGHTSYVYSVSFSPDGNTLASGSADKTIRLWNPHTGARLRTLTGHTNQVVSVSFSPDGNTLASGSLDKTVRLWDAATGANTHILTGHTDGVSEVSFSPDGNTLASGSHDKTVRLWTLTPPATVTPPVTIAPSSAKVSVSPSPVESPAVGAQLTVALKVTGGANVAGYQATVQFDTAALRYVSSANGDYLAAGAFFVPAAVSGNKVSVGATSLSGESKGDGTLATLTFEVVAVKASTLTLSDVVLSDSAGAGSHPQVQNGQVVEPTQVKGDVNGDGVVNIQDLVLVAGRLGQTGQNSADMNGDGVVNIQDLVLVAGRLGTTAAPAAQPQSLAMLTAADVEGWLTQAQGLPLTDAMSQRGILFLEHLQAALTPKETVLLPNYPNPFNPETWIPYQLVQAADVQITIYDIEGAVVRQLDLGHQAAGFYTARSKAAYWDGRNTNGESVASGVYFYQFQTGDYSATRRMVILK